MSAFICNDEQFETVVNVWADAVTILGSGEDGPPPSLVRCQEVADELLRENVRSVNFRYGEKKRPRPCKFVRRVAYPMTSALQAIRFLECVDYQSCERNDYKKSEAYRLNQSMRLDLFRLFVRSTQIERMKWTTD